VATIGDFINTDTIQRFVQIATGGTSGRQLKSMKRRRTRCAKSAPEYDVFLPLGLILSGKQIPQITENTEK
jgi:hypothetical protein